MDKTQVSERQFRDFTRKVGQYMDLGRAMAAMHARDYLKASGFKLALSREIAEHDWQGTTLSSTEMLENAVKVLRQQVKFTLNLVENLEATIAALEAILERQTKP